MKIKTIPFDLETAKKIQAGEIKGKIKTREGKDVRVICWDKKDDSYPIVALITYDDGMELIDKCDSNGRYISDGDERQSDLVLVVPNTEPQFKPFDRVLVRDNDSQVWRALLFSHIDKDGNYCTCGFAWEQCIPFEGNEHLVGTTDKPKED